MVSQKNLKKFLPLGYLLALAFFLRLPSLFEPASYGDEGVYQVLGQAVSRGNLLYQNIWDNKPPFLYLLYALFDGDLFSVRLVSLIFLLFTIVVFFLLAKKIFSPKSALISTFIFTLLFSLPLLEGNIANAENFMLLPIISAFYLGFCFLKNKKMGGWWLVAGFLLGLAFLFKIVAIFDFAALTTFLLITHLDFKNRQKNVKIIPSLVFLVLGFGFPFAATALFFLSQRAFGDFYLATFSQNVSYVAWGNQLLTPFGWLILKLFLLLGFGGFLFLKQKAMEKSQLLIFAWFSFSLFNALFAQRPYTHYLLVLLPSFCLLVVALWAKVKFRPLSLFLVFLALYLALTQFWLYRQTFAYYGNFFSFLSGKKSPDKYYSFWGKNIARDYQVAEFLRGKTKPVDPVFIWGNNPQIYALAKRPVAGRFTVAYHILSYPWAMEETVAALEKTRPRYLVILKPQTDPLKNLEIIFRRDYHLFFEAQGFTVYERGI